MVWKSLTTQREEDAFKGVEENSLFPTIPKTNCYLGATAYYKNADFKKNDSIPNQRI
ncbi:hypothetical protein N9I19_20595 [Peribacillus sp. CSMR9]|nr:hypothetical protein [Peribacillus sp. CSMR9]